MFAKPATFWSSFVLRHWEQKPAYFPRLFDPEIMDSETLFEAIVMMPSRVGADRLWLAKNMPLRRRDDFALAPLDPFGPLESDGSLAAFFERSARGFKKRPFGINVHHLQLASPPLWFRFREFIGGLIEETGELPTQKWDIDTFLGTYEATPFGIHRDNASVFAVGVVGQRSYYFWPEDHFEPGDPALKTPDLEEIQPHLEDAIRIDVGPGDVVYWPSSHWHIAMSDGQPSAVVQVSAYFGTRLSDLVSGEVAELIAARLGDRDVVPVYPTVSEEELPSPLADAEGALGDSIEKGELSEALKRFWLRRRTADGFASVPEKASESDLHPDLPISLLSERAIGWASDANGGILIAANGLILPHGGSRVVSKVLEALAGGGEFTPAELQERFASNTNQETEIHNLLHLLDRCRVFHRPA